MKKLKLIQITFGWSESPAFDRAVVCKTWAEAKKALLNLSEYAPKNGSYDKTDFRIDWADGQVYTGRYDLVHHSVEMPDLRGHVESHLKFVVGEKKPDHMSDEQYANLLTRLPTEHQETARRMLDKCSLEDEE